MFAQSTTTPAAPFATLEIAPLLDALCSAVDLAREMAASNTRWLNAIDSAWGWLLEQDAVSYDHAAHALRVESASEAGRFYVANGACQCRAFEQHNACWHRAAARLVRRALELAEDARDAAEVEALAAELYRDAQADGVSCYTLDIAREGARSRLPGLLNFAAEWDAQAAALGARIARAALAAAD